jgi:glycosyltransferase involved in cell wall biosynthesis
MSKSADILFVHNNFPAQYKLIAGHLSKLPEFRVFAISSGAATEQAGIRLQRYSAPQAALESSHPFARRFDLECRRAEQVIYAANVLKLSGMSPQAIFVHPGWGESLPLKQIFPDAKICLYCEFYYRPEGADVGFDPEFGQFGIDGLTRIRLRNAATLLGLVDAEVGIAPTQWQRDLFPSEFQGKLQVIHDGVDTETLQPRRSTFTHPALPRALQTGDEVLTFVARNLEPYRGFHVFMRALPRILAERPNAVACVVGGTEVSYGNPPAGADNWKTALSEELRGSLDLGRVHFLGTLPYEQYVTLLRVSRVHTYLTYPFVLSWSLLEALALECVVVASDTGPVREVIRNGENGLLVPFFDCEALASKIIDVLATPERFASLGKRARADLVRDFSFEGVVLPRYMALIDDLLAGGAGVAS